MGMHQVELDDIESQRVLLRVDLDDLNRLKTKVARIAKTINILLSKKCSVCVLPSIGPAIMQPGRTSEAFYEVFESVLQLSVKVINVLDDKTNFEQGSVYLLQNSFYDEHDANCRKQYVQLLLQSCDVVVFDTLKHLDSYYASTWGIVSSGMPVSFGLQVMALRDLKRKISSSRVGLVIGGEKVFVQCRLIRALIPNLSFIALGGSLALSFMGKEQAVADVSHSGIVEMLNLMRRHQVQVMYPVDVVAYSPVTQRSRVCLYQDLELFEEVHDISLQSINRIVTKFSEPKLDVLMFAGCMGTYQDPRYARGSEELLRSIANSTVQKAVIGIEAATMADRMGIIDQMDVVLEGNAIEFLYLSGQYRIFDGVSI